MEGHWRLKGRGESSVQLCILKLQHTEKMESYVQVRNIQNLRIFILQCYLTLAEIQLFVQEIRG